VLELLIKREWSPLAIETKCMKCGQVVWQHRKSEKVKAHLNQCRPFSNLLQRAGLKGNDVPDWVILRSNGKNKKVLQRSQNNRLFASYAADAAILAASESSPSAATTLSVATLSTTATCTAASTKVHDLSDKMDKKRRARTIHDYLIPPLSAANQAAFQEEIAMHFYMSATPFVRMDEPYLLQSLKELCPDVKLPTQKDLSGKLLQSAHKKVRSKLDTWLKKDQFACITLDAWSNIKHESVIN
jgi:hypothetical protein